MLTPGTLPRAGIRKAPPLSATPPNPVSRRTILRAGAGVALVAFAGAPQRAQATPAPPPSDVGVRWGQLYAPTYLAQDTVYTRSVAQLPALANSAAIGAYLRQQPLGYNSFGVVTSINHTAYTLPVYQVDSTVPGHDTAQVSFSGTVPAGVASRLSGTVPWPSWAVPAPGGDKSLAIYDLGTGLIREYFLCQPDGPGRWTARYGAYYQAARGLSDLAAHNYAMQHTEGSSAVVGMITSLAQIGIAELRAGRINHAVPFTIANAAAGVTSWPARQNDGTDTSGTAPAQGQWFRISPSVDLAAKGLRPLTLLIAQAAQRHGGFAMDKNLFCHAFNCESGVVEEHFTGVNPWGPKGDLTAKFGSFDVNDFPWELTEWAPVNWGRPRSPVQLGSPVPGSLISLAPSLVLDTATGLGAPAGALSAGQTHTIQLAGVGGVPSTGASAVLLKVSAHSATGSGSLVAYAANLTQAPPLAQLSFAPGAVCTATTLVRLASGKAKLTVSGQGTTQLRAEVVGYLVAGTPTRPGAIVTTSPARLLDTVSGVGATVGRVNPGQEVLLRVIDRAGIPAGAGGVIMSVTVRNPASAGTVSVYPSDASSANASTVGFGAASTVTNLIVCPLGSTGRVRLRNDSPGAVDLAAAVSGWWIGGSALDAGTVSTIVPRRVLDSRSGVGTSAHLVTAGEVITVPIAGRVGLPTRLGAGLVKLTATGGSAAGRAAAYPSDAAPPTLPTLDYPAAAPRSAMAWVRVGADGSVRVRNAGASAQLVLDVHGWLLLP